MRFSSLLSNALAVQIARTATCVALSAGLLAAQSSTNGWPRVNQSSAQTAADQQEPSESPGNPQDPSQSNADGSYIPQPIPVPQQYQPYSSRVPAEVVIPQGTYITVHLNQTLSSDHNHPGDGFSASLVDPVVASGVVVAQRGQTLGGQVVEAEKAGRVEGTSKLRIQVTDLTLVDGQQLPIQGQFISWHGNTSVGRDAGAVAATTATGAAIGAAVGWGTGAAIGAAAGATAGLIGVLLTRGHPTVIPSESVVTFRLQASVKVYTDNAPEAFQYVQASDYPHDYAQPSRPATPAYAAMPAAPPPPAPPAAYYYGPSYYPYQYPYYGYPGVYFFAGPRYYYGYPHVYGYPHGGYPYHPYPHPHGH
jgi:hypothetical protein